MDWAQKRRTARQLIRKNPVLKNQAIFFSQSERADRLGTRSPCLFKTPFPYLHDKRTF